MLGFLLGSLLYGQAALSTPFVKTVSEADGKFEIRTSAHKLTAPGKPDVWLVGVAHVGEKQYYEKIQRLLNTQDEVLFEGVKPDALPPGSTTKPHKLDNGFYTVLSGALGLDFQLADIDYVHPNWVNSDLSLSELEKLNKAGGKGKPTEFDTVKQLFDPNSPMVAAFVAFLKTATPGTKEALKLFIVTKLSTIDPMTVFTSDPATANVLLHARNKSVEEAFAKALASPTPPKSVAIFYGALHQTEIEKDFVEKYGYKDVEQQWFTAAHADKSLVDEQGRQLLNLLDKLPVAPAKPLTIHK